MADLESLMVHRAPMLLIDELLEYGENHATTEVWIKPDMLFVQEQGLPCWVGIELMAQTVSLLAGVRVCAANSVATRPKLAFYWAHAVFMRP